MAVPSRPLWQATPVARITRLASPLRGGGELAHDGGEERLQAARAAEHRNNRGTHDGREDAVLDGGDAVFFFKELANHGVHGVSPGERSARSAVFERPPVVIDCASSPHEQFATSPFGLRNTNAYAMPFLRLIIRMARWIDGKTPKSTRHRL